MHLSYQNNGLTFHAEMIAKWILWAAKYSFSFDNDFPIPQIT